MTDEHPLSRIADRGVARGADDVLRDARAESTPPARRPVRLAAAAAAIVALVAGAVALWSNGDEPASLETADPEPETVTTTSAPPDTTVTAAPKTTVIGFRAVDGIIQLTNSGASTTETTVVGGVRGEEGSTNLAVDRDGTVVFHEMIYSGCRSDIVRTEVDGSSDVLVENAASPALDDAGARLAYASGSQCTRDGDLLAVRDLASGQTSTLKVGGDDGLPFRIDDVEWAGDRIAVLAHQYDGEVISARYVLLYAVPDGGTPEFDSQVLLGDESRGDLDDFVFQDIEPVPGKPGSIVRAVSSSGDGSALEVIDLGSGETETLLSVEIPITSFSLRTLDDVFYVASEPQIPGERARVDTLRRRFENADFVVAEHVSSVATTLSSTDAAPNSFPSAVQEFTSSAWEPGQVQWREDGRIKAEGYNEFIGSERPGYASDPSASALALLGADESTVDVSVTETGETIRVTVTTEISGDDSTSGTQQTLHFETRDGLLEYIDGEWAQRCGRGDNTSEFVVGAICP